MSNTAEAPQLRLGATSQDVQRNRVQKMVDMLTAPVLQQGIQTTSLIR